MTMPRIWNVNDLPADRMASGYHGGYGMFAITVDKKSIFWDLPYWSTLLIRHNFNFMHIEKSVFDNIFNTVMDIKGKMKDNMNARTDLKIICNRPKLELDERRPNVMPKAVSIFNYPGRASDAMKKRWLSGPERHIIETYILTNCEVHPELNYTDKELLKCHYWGPSAEVTSFNAYFVNGYNFQTKRHDTGKSTMNCEKNDLFILAQQAVQVYFTEYPSMKRDKVDWMAICKIKAQRVVDNSKWTETDAYQPKEIVPVPIVVVDNQSYDLRDPNGLQVVLEAVGTSWRLLHENNDDNEDEDEDCSGND
ncbi:UNVERIFIED_CONTAM: hypothetical protein Scaly_1784900 [Sesamum calycinum]|uniref:DUF4216 domain-containing protein n=1 Tax=Sesamum calycinum TaxID=2727403 RepID=A0AAW2NV41_9LAMI